MSDDPKVFLWSLSRPVEWNGKPWVFAVVRAAWTHVPSGTYRNMDVEVMVPYRPEQSMLDVTKAAIEEARVIVTATLPAFEKPQLEPWSEQIV